MLIFSDFRNEVEKTSFTNPKIKFDSHSITVIARPDLSDLTDLFIILIFSFLFLLKTILLVISVPCFVLFWHRLFVNFKGCGIFRIDFVLETINIKNRLVFINVARRIFGITTENRFSSIKEISYTENSLIDKLGYLRFKKRYILFLETFKDIPIAISQFEREKDVKAIVSILKKFLLSKEKIIV